MERLRPLPDLGDFYDHLADDGHHRLRIDATIALGRAAEPWTVTDLSAGTGRIPLAIHPAPTLGDFAPGWPIQGRIEDTVATIGRCDLFVCTETLEHLDDPAGVLAAVRGKARRLLVSLPEARGRDTNGEHVWQFDREGGEALLASCGWEAVARVTVDQLSHPYRYHVWLCS